MTASGRAPNTEPIDNLPAWPGGQYRQAVAAAALIARGTWPVSRPQALVRVGGFNEAWICDVISPGDEGPRLHRGAPSMNGATTLAGDAKPHSSGAVL